MFQDVQTHTERLRHILTQLETEVRQAKSWRAINFTEADIYLHLCDALWHAKGAVDSLVVELEREMGIVRGRLNQRDVSP